MGAGGEQLLAHAGGALGSAERALLAELHGFTAERMAAAAATRERLLQGLSEGGRPTASAGLHAFLRECWEALDGLAREVNVCMYDLFPQAGLYPPLEMTRQCTFYVVRKKLHEHPAVARHAVARLLWERTRERPDPPYVRLSFLYNLSLFLCLPLPGGLLPGSQDIPPHATQLVRPAHVDRCPVGQGTCEMLDWLKGFAGECYAALSRALGAPGPSR